MSNVHRLNTGYQAIENAIDGAPHRPGLYVDQSGTEWQIDFTRAKIGSSVTLTNQQKRDMGAFTLDTAVKVNTVHYKRPKVLSVSSLLSVEAKIPSKFGGVRAVPMGAPLTVPVEIDGITIPEDLNNPHNMSTNANMLEQWSARLPLIIRAAKYLS
jgi:hypothetical protein